MSDEMGPEDGAVRVGPPRLRLMAVADFGLEPGTRVVVDRPIDELLAGLGLEAEGVVADRLDTSTRRDMRARLALGGLDDFTPAGVLRHLEPAAEWHGARERLATLAADDGAAVREALPPALRDGALGQRLASSGGGAGRVEALLAQVDGGGSPRDEARAEIDRRLARQAAAIVSRPWFSELEEAWRGVDFLQRRLAALGGVELELFSAPKADYAELFFRQVFHQEYEGEVETPLGLVVLGYDFDRGLPDLERLEHTARMGESLRLPFLGNLGPAFWGLKRLPLLAGLPDLEGRLSGPEYVKWNRFRGEEAALWLALTVNRFLLRGRWVEEGGPALDGLDDAAIPEADDPPLWGFGCWTLAVAVAMAWKEKGLELPITAVELGEMAVRPYGGSRSEPYAYPLQVPLGEARVIELGRCGLVPLVAKRDEARLRFPLAPTLHRPRRYTEDEATRASFFAATLPHQVFAALASHRLQQIAEDLELGLDDEALERSFRQQLEAFLGDEPVDEAAAAEKVKEGAVEETEGEAAMPSVMIEIETPADRPETRVVTARLRPRFAICGGSADLVLGTAVLVG